VKGPVQARAEAPTTTLRDPERSAAVLLGVHVFISLAFVVWHPVHVEHEDVARFVQIATTPGWAYRDFDVEYAPLETAVIDLGFDSSIGSAIPRAALISLACDIALFLVIRRGWGLRPATTYLLLTVPLQVFMPFRLDYLPVLLAVAAFARVKNTHERSGGLLLAAAILFKLWPVVLVPALVVRRQWRALIVCGFATATGLLVWVGLGGLDSVRYVTSFRGATGWQVESTIGSILAVAGHALRIEAGAVRVGEIPSWAPMALRAISLCILAGIWWKARRDASDLAGFPAAASVATVIAFSPVSSSQYVAWLLPWAAVAIEERPRSALLLAAMTASVMSAAAFVVYWRVDSPALLAWVAVFRAAAIVVIPLLWLRETSNEPAPVSEVP
jgi:hypothetical protein